MERETEDLAVRDEGAVVVVRLKNENLLSVPAAERIEREVRGLVAGGATRLVLDFAAVRYAGSAILAMILTARQEVGDRGRVVLAGVQRLAEVLRISKTDTLFLIAEDAAAGIAAARA